MREIQKPLWLGLSIAITAILIVLAIISLWPAG